MKIALVHYSAPPVIGGVETIIAAHARLFAAAGHAVRLIVRHGGEDNPCVVRLSATDPLDELRAALAGCDVVIAHNVLTMPFDLPLTEALWRLAEEMKATRFIAWVHDFAAGNPDYPHAYHEPPWQRLAQAAPRFEYVTISEHRARQLTTLTSATARVIPNAIEPTDALGLTRAVADFAESHELFARDFLLLHPARLLRRKNVEFGLAVTAELRARGRRVAYLVTGAADPHNAASAQYAAELATRRSELGLEQDAIFIGESFTVTNTDLGALYALADALFFPSRQEGFGLPILEAALHRLPTFCTDTAPMNSLLESTLHTFAPDASPAAVATLIERTLDHAPSHRARKEVLRRYSWAVIDRDFLQPLLAGSLT